MSTKQTATDEAFNRLCPNGYFASIFSNPRTRDRALFEAAWTARGVADIAAVEGERLEHNSPKCIESGTDDCSDCAYHQALDDGKNAIRALDEDVK